MAMTLEEMKKGMSDKVFSQIVDIFLRQSTVLQMLPFDDCVSASGGGSTMKYKYLRKVLPATAEFRKLGGSYTNSVATKQECEANLAIMGGAVQMDRVLNMVAGNFDNLAYQIEEHIKAIVSLFHYTLINGDATTTASTDHPEFQGLDSMLAGTATEYGASKSIDLSTIDKIKANADEFYEALSLLIQTTAADAVLTNTEMITKIQTVARVLGYKTESEEAFGKRITTLAESLYCERKRCDRKFGCKEGNQQKDRISRDSNNRTDRHLYSQVRCERWFPWHQLEWLFGYQQVPA